jgi:hypothetical protein
MAHENQDLQANIVTGFCKLLTIQLTQLKYLCRSWLVHTHRCSLRATPNFLDVVALSESHL